MQIRKIFLAMVLCMMTIFVFGCGSSQDTSKQESAATTTQATSSKDSNAMNKSLVVYFSYSGNTEYVAQEIAKETGADVFKLEAADNRYDIDNDTLNGLAREEVQQGARPEFQGQVENMAQYDTVYIGFPNWCQDMPMIMYSFLDKYNLSGKKIAPFVTHEGSGLSKIPQSIQQHEPDARVVEGLALKGASVRSSGEQITSWIKKVQAAK